MRECQRGFTGDGAKCILDKEMLLYYVTVITGNVILSCYYVSIALFVSDFTHRFFFHFRSPSIKLRRTPQIWHQNERSLSNGSRRWRVLGFWWFDIFSTVSDNCAKLFKSGFTVSGIFKIGSDDNQAFDVFCDQTTEGGGGLSFRKDSTAPSISTETGPTTNKASVTWAASSGSGWTRSTDSQVKPTTNCELSWRTLTGRRFTQSTTRLLWQTKQTTIGWAWRTIQVTMKCGQVRSIQWCYSTILCESYCSAFSWRDLKPKITTLTREGGVGREMVESHPSSSPSSAYKTPQTQNQWQQRYFIICNGSESIQSGTKLLSI